MSLETFLIIAHGQTLFSLLGFLLTLRAKPSQSVVRIMGLLFLFSFLAQIGSLALGKPGFDIANPNYSASLYGILEVPLLSWLYFSAVGQKNYGRVFASIAVAFVLFATYNLVFIQKESINSYSLIVGSIITILYSLFYFYWLLRELPTLHLHKFPMFWINSGWIIFSSGNLFLFAFTSYLVNVLNNNLLYYWSMFNFLAIIKSSMIVYGIWLDRQNTKSHS